MSRYRKFIDGQGFIMSGEPRPEGIYTDAGTGAICPNEWENADPLGEIQQALIEIGYPIREFDEKKDKAFKEYINKYLANKWRDNLEFLAMAEGYLEIMKEIEGRYFYDIIPNTYEVKGSENLTKYNFKGEPLYLIFPTTFYNL